MNRLTSVTIIIFMFSFVSTTGTGEVYGQSRKSIKNEQESLLQKADLAYENFNYQNAVNYYEEYLKKENNLNKDVLIKLAGSYYFDGKKNEALRIYKMLFPSPSTTGAKPFQLRIAELYARVHDYDQASLWLLGVEGYKTKANVYSRISEIELMKRDSLSWNVALLDVNTPQNEYSPCLVDSLLYFSSDYTYSGTHIKSKKKEMNVNYAHLWKVPVKDVNMSTSIDKIYDKINNNITPLDGFENMQYNCAPVSVDKNKHFYFSKNYDLADKSGLRHLCVTESSYTEDGHLKMNIIPFSDFRVFTVMHPTVNADGTLMVVSSNKSGGIGGYDLYYARRKGINQPWSELKSLGKNINTIGDEVYPTITSDDYLYFSSNVLGLGGLDIFRISLKDAMKGTNMPEHLSYPINSSSDDFGWTQDATNAKGYFSSDRLGNTDIFSFNYSYKEPLKEKVVNKDDIKIIQHVDSTYFFSVLFNNNKCHINPSNCYLLAALVRIMNKYPCLKLQIRSHTDVVGGDTFNQKLSTERALAIRNYLVEKGIPAYRMDTLCLGKTQQLNQNRNTLERTMNRRVLFHTAPTGCNLNVDSLLSIDLVAHNNNKIDLKKIFVLKVNGKFMVQVGAFKTIAKVSALAEKVKSIFPNNVYLFNNNKIDDNWNNWNNYDYHQVRVGYFETLIEADKMAALIEATGILD